MPRSNTVEEHWGVKDDGVDSSELLEHHEEQGDGELGAVLGLEEVTHGVRGQVTDAGCLCDVCQLLINIVGASDL